MLRVRLTVCSEQQPSQPSEQTQDYELLDTSRPDDVVYSHPKSSSVRSNDSADVHYEEVDV